MLPDVDEKKQAYRAIASLRYIDWETVVKAAQKFLPEEERTSEYLRLVDAEVSDSHTLGLFKTLALLPEAERVVKVKELIQNPRLVNHIAELINLLPEAEKANENKRLFDSYLANGHLSSAQELGRAIGRNLTDKDVLFVIEEAKRYHYGEVYMAKALDFLSEPSRSEELNKLLVGMITKSSPKAILEVALIVGHDLTDKEKELILESCLSRSALSYSKEAAKLLGRELTLLEVERIFEGQLVVPHCLELALGTAQILPEPNRTICREKILARALQTENYFDSVQKIVKVIGRELTRPELLAFLERISGEETYRQSSVATVVNELLKGTD